MWPSITAEKITKILKDIIIFISSKPDEFYMSRMHDTMNKETGLEERNKNMEKEKKERGGYFMYRYKHEGRSAIFI